MSNFDDMHENEIHDYMKWIKFGYGIATDDTAEDIGSGRLSKNQGVSIVLEKDPMKSQDLSR